MPGTLRFSTFPRTDMPPSFTTKLVEVFRVHEDEISTAKNVKGLKSDQVLAVLRPRLVELGFIVEEGKQASQKIRRPVFFGENALPDLQYQIDAYNVSWRCGLEIEAGRAWMGNAVYRDLIQAMVMVDLDCLALAVPIGYRYLSAKKSVTSKDYENAVAVADAIYGHTRIKMPFKLILIGY